MYNSRITNPVSEKMVYDADGHQRSIIRSTSSRTIWEIHQHTDDGQQHQAKFIKQ